MSSDNSEIAGAESQMVATQSTNSSSPRILITFEGPSHTGFTCKWSTDPPPHEGQFELAARELFQVAQSMREVRLNQQMPGLDDHVIDKIAQRVAEICRGV